MLLESVHLVLIPSLIILLREYLYLLTLQTLFIGKTYLSPPNFFYRNSDKVLFDFHSLYYNLFGV